MDFVFLLHRNLQISRKSFSAPILAQVRKGLGPFMHENEEKLYPWMEQFSLEDLKHFMEIKATVCYFSFQQNTSDLLN